MASEKWSANFFRWEVEKSDIAVAHGFENRIPENQVSAWQRGVMEGCEQIRQQLDAGVVISSGFRCDHLNRLLRPGGSSSTSLHLGTHWDKPTHRWLLCCAFDLECPKLGNLVLFELLLRTVHEFRQRDLHSILTGGLPFGGNATLQLCDHMLPPEEVIWEYDDPTDPTQPAWVHLGFIFHGRAPSLELLRRRYVWNETLHRTVTTTELYEALQDPQKKAHQLGATEGHS
jgi:hypothetical protein